MNFLIKTAILTTLSTSAIASSFYVTANIVSIDPVYVNKTISEPYEECFTQEFRSGGSSSTDQILGGLLGGAIGNRFGGGSGKDAMTVAGALLGASMASNNHSGPQYTTREVCETRYRKNDLTTIGHYRVGYSYNGSTHHYNTGYRPTSNTVKLKVILQPY